MCITLKDAMIYMQLLSKYLYMFQVTDNIFLRNRFHISIQLKIISTFTETV